MLSFFEFLQNNHDTELHEQSDISNEAYIMLSDAKKSCPDLNADQIKFLLGRKWFMLLTELIYLISFIDKYVNNDGILFISQTDKYLLRCYGSKATVYYKIQYLKKAKVLFDLKTHYSYVGVHRAKCYYANVNNINCLFSMYYNECMSRKIQPKAIELLNHESAFVERELDSDGKIKEDEPLKRFRGFCSNMGIDSSKHSKYQIVTMLYKKYPLFHYQCLADSLNENAEHEEVIRFEPKFTMTTRKRLGIVREEYRKISIRATSSVCSKTSLKKQQKLAEKRGRKYKRELNRDYREDYLYRKLGNDRDENDEFDVKASVPRIAHATEYPEDGMGNMQEDIYRTIFYPYYEELKQLVPSVHEFCDAREIFKSLFMRLYFCSSSEESFTKLKRLQIEMLRSNPKETFEVDFLGPNQDRIMTLIEHLKKAVNDYCGDNSRHSTAVIFDESCIYLEVRAILRDRGIRVVQVYDGFYFRHGERPDDMEEIIAEAYRRYRSVCQQHSEKKKQLNLKTNAAKTA